MKKKRIVIVAVALIVVLSILLYVQWTNGAWAYSESLTHEFYNQYVPQGWAGYQWKIYTKTPHDMNPILDIRCYGAVISAIPNPNWALVGEGHYIIANHTFQWDWSDFPWDL